MRRTFLNMPRQPSSTRVTENGALNADWIEREQHACHGLAWLAAYTEAIKQMAAYAERLTADGRFGEMEALLTQIGVGGVLQHRSSAASRSADPRWCGFATSI